jgi:pimeloyl-ACP methyl ester carboxylesterase
VDRRSLLRAALLTGFGARLGTSVAQDARETPRERYARLQRALLARSGLQFAERDVQLSSPSLRAHVVESGSGEPLLLVHGGNGIGAHWLPLNARLSGRQLIVPDRPGCGLTDSFLYDGVDMRSHGAQFVAGILDAAGTNSASIVGNSLGGYFALCFALAYPERVRKLILAGGPAFSAGYQPLSAEAREARVRGSRQPGRAGLGALVADPANVSSDLLEVFDAALTLPGTEESWRSIWRSARADRTTLSLHAELEKLRAPTLLIWGEADRIDPPQPIAIAIADRLPNARLVLMRNAGHLPWLDQPDECAALIGEFLADA